MESLEPETLNDSEEDKPRKYAPESHKRNNKDDDNNTQYQSGNPAIPAAVNYKVNQRRLWGKRDKTRSWQ